MSDVPEGYKMSEVGVIPEGWEVKTLRDCLLRNPEYGINAPAVPYSDNLPTYIRITDISEEGRFLPEKKSSVRNIDSNNYFLEKDDIVFARTGASTGKTYLYNSNDGDLVFAGFLIRVKVNPNELIAQYLKSYTETGTYWNWVKIMSMRSGQPGINGNEYTQLRISLPPLPEQQAIASALSDVDALVAALGHLITKKRNIKQGAMQQLLTGEKRLPGFSGAWEVKKLGEVGYFSKGKGIRKDEVVGEGLPCIRYGEIYTIYNNYIKSFKSFITQSLANESIEIKTDDLLFAGSGETAEEIGKCVAFVGTEKVFAGGDIVILRPSSINNNSLFLGFLLNNPIVTKQKARMGQGDAVVHISGKNLSEIQIPLPPTKAEQTAIAQILSDMDTEIEALKQKRDKYKAIKQGMMQELLTGKTRLVKEDKT